jgi:hypothetical protein
VSEGCVHQASSTQKGVQLDCWLKQVAAGGSLCVAAAAAALPALPCPADSADGFPSSTEGAFAAGLHVGKGKVRWEAQTARAAAWCCVLCSTLDLSHAPTTQPCHPQHNRA